MEDGWKLKLALDLIKGQLLFTSPEEGSPFMGQLDYGAEKPLEVFAEEGKVVHYSTEALALLQGAGCGNLLYSFCSGLKRSNGHSAVLNDKLVTHVCQLGFEELALLWTKFEAIFNHSLEEGLHQFPMFMLGTVDQQVIHDGNELGLMVQIIQDHGDVIHPDLGGACNAHGEDLIAVYRTTKIGEYTAILFTPFCERDTVVCIL